MLGNIVNYVHLSRQQYLAIYVNRNIIVIHVKIIEEKEHNILVILAFNVFTIITVHHKIIKIFHIKDSS